jgi:hypothetical protein
LRIDPVARPVRSRRRWTRYAAPFFSPEDYETPQGHFTGEISWVRIDIGKEAFSDPAGMEEAPAGRS